MSHNFVSFFVCNNEKLIVWCISARKNHFNLTKNNHKFQASIDERRTSLNKGFQNSLKVPVEKF